MSKTIREQLCALFDDVMDTVSEKDLRYSKTNFPIVFERYYSRYEQTFCAMEEELESHGYDEAWAKEMAEVLPCYAKEKMGEHVSKRKKEAILVDYNMRLVIFILPMYNHHNTEAGRMLSRWLVESWNACFGTNIGNTDFNQIQNGFQKRLCYITTAVCRSLGKSDDCYELETLRAYRDQYLTQQEDTKALVLEYYNIAPTIVKRIDALEEAREIYESIWHTYLKPCIALIEQGEKEACKERYTEMVRALQNTYLYS